MNFFSLKTLIDDILLIVRNNNISESEDFSRDQIASWIMQYKTYIQKKKEDAGEEGDDEDPDDSLQTTVGPIQLEYTDKKNVDCDCCDSMIMRTKEKINTVQDSADDIVSVSDQNGCVIQYMHKLRKHYHNFRRYTYAEPVCWFEDGYIYVEGAGIDSIDAIYITGQIDESKTADSEDDITIPGWMIPDIKKAIFANELAFMLGRPSDDSNNSTLASVKPNGPQYKEK